MAPTRFLSLSTELVCRILECLEFIDLIHCTEVNVYLRTVIQNSVRLQYIMELSMHRMVSVLPFSQNPSLPVRLNILREREYAWKRLEWKYSYSSDLCPNPLGEFAGGINAIPIYRGFIRSIKFLKFHSADPTSGKDTTISWNHTMDGLSVVRFTMDPSQDLLILVAFAPPLSDYVFEVHLRSLSTNEPHPKAPIQKILTILRRKEMNTLYHHQTMRIQILGHMLALFCKTLDRGGRIEIWNWHEFPCYTCTISHELDIQDFCFLSHDTLLIAEGRRGELNVFKIVVDPAVSSCTPIMQACYELPPKPDSSRYSTISIDCSPTMDLDAIPKSEKLTGAERAMEMPFYYSCPDERIQIFTIVLDQNRFVFFANVSTFLKPCFHHRRVPWKEWGPQNTRWFEHAFYTAFKHALYGFRVLDTVLCEPLVEDEDDDLDEELMMTERRLRLRDFNPNSVRRSAHGQIEGWKCYAVTEPSTTITDGSYEQDIVSSLPYTEVVSEATFYISDVMMDNSRLWLFKNPEGGGGGLLRVGTEILVM